MLLWSCVFDFTNNTSDLSQFTIFDDPKQKNGISQLESARQVGISTNTGVMMEREDSKLLSGNIEVDGAYIGDKKNGETWQGIRKQNSICCCCRKNKKTSHPELI